MNNIVKVLVGIIIVFVLTYLVLDINKVNTTKTVLFESIRNANYNSLYKMRNEPVITETLMLEQWLVNYALSNDIPTDLVKIEFVLVNIEPTYYVVRIVGTNHYSFISESVYLECISSATFVR